MKKKLYYDSKYFQDRDYLDLHIAESLCLIIKENNFKRILDVGCGTGKLVNYLNKKGYEAHGCDISEEAVKLALRTNKKGRIKKTSATRLPYENNSIDLISAISTIEHLTRNDVGKFLEEAYRVLKPNGIIFLITPNFNSPLRYLKGSDWFGYSDPTHTTYFTPKSLTRLLRKHHFSNIKSRLKSVYNIPTDFHLPKQLHNLPMPIKNVFNYLMVSSPFANYRDSFWVKATKTTSQGLNDSNENRNWFIILSVIIFLGLSLRIIGILNAPVLFDEAHQILLSRSKDLFLSIKVGFDTHPPINVIILTFWQILSKNLIFTRIPSLLFGTITIACIGIFAKKLFDKKTGLIAALLMAISPAQIYYSSIARMYSLAVLESVIVTYLLICVIQKTKKLHVLVIPLLIGLYTHFFFVIYLVVANLYLLLKAWNNPVFLKKLLKFNLVSFFLFLPAIILVLMSKRSFPVPLNIPLKLPLFYISPFFPWEWILTLNPIYPKNIEIISTTFLILSASFALILLLSFFKFFASKKVSPLLFIYILTPLLIFAFSYVFFRIAAVRSFVIFSPLFFLIISAFISNLKKTYRIFTLSVLVMLTTIFSITFFQKNYGQNDLLRQVYSNFNKEDIVVYNDFVLFLPTKIVEPNGDQKLAALDYLETNPDEVAVFGLKETNVQDLPKNKKVWFVFLPTNLASYDKVASDFETSMKKDYHQSKRLNYDNLQVILYEPKDF